MCSVNAIVTFVLCMQECYGVCSSQLSEAGKLGGTSDGTSGGVTTQSRLVVEDACIVLETLKKSMPAVSDLCWGDCVNCPC